MSKQGREYYLYADTPVLFQSQPDGGLLILALRLQDKRVVPDTSFYGLIHFDRDGVAQKISRKNFEESLRKLGVPETAFEEAAQVDALVA